MDKKLKILIAASIYPPDPGGPALHAKAYYEGFPKLGIDTGLVSLSHFRRWPRVLRHILYFETILIKALKYDLIYAYDAVGSGIPAYLAALAMGKKFVVRVGGDLAWEREAEFNRADLSMTEWYEAGNHRSNRLFKLSRWLLSRAGAIVVTSPILKAVYVDHYSIKEEKIVVVPNPTPTVSIVSGDIEQTIVYASRLVAYKNLSTVLEALVSVFQDFTELRFVIMGDGPEKIKLQKLASQLGIGQRVIFKGTVSQEEVLDSTARCRLAIAPALTEFNPNYILQAIASGKPFLISKENGFTFDIPEEFQFDPRNSNELATKLRSLLDERNYNIAQEKVKNIVFKQTWDDVLTANIRVIQTLLNG